MPCRKFFASIAGFVALTCICSLTAWAQFGASLQGTVQDKSGAKIANAKVSVTEQATGVIHDATSSAEGFYRLSELPPGLYTVAVDATGFKSHLTKNVTVAAESARGLDITLEIGNASETVTVTGEVPSLQTENATVQGTLPSIA